MSITASAATSFEATVDQAPTGLVGIIGVRIVDGLGGITLARHTTGIVEAPALSGIYTATMTAPNTAGPYVVTWDTGGGSPVYVSEDLTVTTGAPLGGDYVAIADMKATLNLAGVTFADADIAVAITAASREIDGICNRRFYLDAGDATRYYGPAGSEIVVIDDLTTLTSVSCDTTGAGTYVELTAGTDFVLDPPNAAADGWPATAIKRSGSGAVWGAHATAIRVIGRFGWPAVPTPIVQATGLLASRLMRRAREAPFGIISPGLDAGDAMHITRVDPDVQTLIRPYVVVGY